MSNIFFLYIALFAICRAQEINDTKMLNPKGCGFRLKDYEFQNSKIVGGSEAEVGDWAWQVGIDFLGRHLCGGSLINSQWVLTAAHCVSGTLVFLPLILGIHNRVYPEDTAITRKVVRVLKHEKYSELLYDYDIALMKLESPVAYNKFISPICIPTETQDYSGKEAYTTGWGATRVNGPSSLVLMQVCLPVLTDKKCIENFRATNPRLNPEIEICAGDVGYGKDSCQGDSGGPLVIQDSDTNDSDRGDWYLIGVTAYGSLTCADGGVYTRVSYFYEWILNRIKLL